MVCATCQAVSYDDLINIVDIGTFGQADRDGIAVSPDGTLAAIEAKSSDLGANATRIRWLIVSLDKAAPPVAGGDGGEPIEFEPEPGVANGNAPTQIPQWTRDSQWFVYRAKHSGRIQLWRSSRDGGVQEQLTAHESDIDSFLIGPTARRIYFTVDAERDNTAEALRQEAARGFLYDERFAPSHGGSVPILQKKIGSARAKLIWVFELNSRTEHLATEEDRKEYAELSKTKSQSADWSRKSRRGKGIVWLADTRVDHSRGVDMPLSVVASTDGQRADARICRLQTCRGYFKGVWMSDDSRSAVFLRWTNGDQFGRLALYRWKVGTSHTTKILETDDLLEACNQNSTFMICINESAISPAKLVKVSLSSGKVETIFDPNPAFQNLTFGRVTPIEWSSASGIKGFGHLVLPVDYSPNRRYPLVIVQYRSTGFLRGGVGDEYPIHVLASRGFAVLSFDEPRDRELYAKAASYNELDRALWNGVSERKFVLSVLEAGIDHLTKLGIIDPQKVGITGLSAGANNGVYALIHDGGRFAAAALSYTRWNPIYFYLAGPQLQRIFVSWGLGDPSNLDSLGEWEEMSIALNAKRISTPLLIQVSDAEFSTEMQGITELTRAQKPVELYVFQNESHVKSQPIHRYSIYKRNVQWFDFWLRGIEDPDPLDNEQYARWRNLRRLQNKGA